MKIDELWPELTWISEQELREKTTKTWQLALERKPPLFSVSNHLESCFFLQGNGGVDGAILDGLELCLCDPAGVYIFSSLKQFWRP